jgi:hypothetical protein
MAQGFPIRLSAALATRAREAAEIQDRSVTEQVEHGARLGQIVEAAVSSSTVARLKGKSYDKRLPQMLAAADTAAARKSAAGSIARRNPVRYGTTAAEPTKILRVESRRRRGA